MNTTSTATAILLPSISRPFCRFFLISLVCCSVLSGQTTYDWIGGSEGDFGVGGNWSPAGPPVEDSIVRFADQGTVLVNLGSDVQMNSFRVTGDSNVTFDMGGNTFTAAEQSTWTLRGNGNSTLILQNGDFVYAAGNNQWIGHTFTSGEKTLRVGVGSRLVMNGETITFNHNSTNVVRLYVEDGAKFDSWERVVMSGGPDSQTHTVVSGHGSEIRTGLRGSGTARSFYLGSDGIATMEILSGAAFSGFDLALGRKYGTGGGADPTRRGNGILIVDGSEGIHASSVTASRFFIGGGAIASNVAAVGDGSGTATFSNGGIGAFNTMRVFHTSEVVDDEPVITWGTLVIDGGHVSVTGTATFDPGSVLRIGLNQVSQNESLLISELNLDATLELTLGVGFSAAISDTIVLIEYQTLSGEFANVGQGDFITIGGYTFEMDYAMGSGSNLIGLTVTAIPEPGNMAVVLGLIALLILRAKRKQAPAFSR